MKNLNKVIDEIQEIRGINNKLWMDILKLAINSSPDEANKILRGINENDKQISKLLGKIK